MENYTITSMETYTEPVVVNTFTWCLQIPPRCPKSRTEMRQRYRIKTETKTRTVKECCEGYVMVPLWNESEKNGCVPICENCHAGVCISPNECQCDSGYRGADCASECLPGSWGVKCEQSCNCGEAVTCNHVDGSCNCPRGLRGPKCTEPCPTDRWGPGCINRCKCEDPLNSCHPRTGRCTDSHVPIEPVSFASFENATEENAQPANSSVMEYNEEAWRTPGSTDNTEDNAESYRSTTTPAYVPETNDPGTNLTEDYGEVKARSQENERSTTARPVIVLVSVPERRRIVENDRAKFAMKNTFLRHVEDNRSPRDDASPKTDYVKTIPKEEPQSPPIPMDIVLIVVASIVSLGLTSVAVVMVLHMRSKLFETVRLSIYEEEKSKSQERESVNTGRISTIVGSGLPQTPVCLSPVFASTPGVGTTLTVEGMEPMNNYANGPATIGLRISGNFHDLLQDIHYDRPPTTLIRLQPDFDPNLEHVYDEIPLQSAPSCTTRNT
ncbi:hypothetical protein KM043_006446 [Ampulex compressa]|nr:hypothetical protein KM043_006446 [Ampulex compressa]